MLRLDQNPPVRFPADLPLAEDSGKWCVAYVKSRQEKALAHDLMRADIHYYLPLVEKKVRRRDNNKLRKTLVPLFPGYLAFAAEAEERQHVFKKQRLSKVLEVADQQQLVEELCQIQVALDGGMAMSLMPLFSPGQRVRVDSGPLLGCEGCIVRNKGKTQFIIQVQMFNQAVAVEIDEYCLKPA